MIVNAPDPVTSLADLDAEQVALAVDVWRERMRAHAGAAYVHLIVNERREAGASLPHTHAQLYALDFVPARDRARARALRRATRRGRWAATCSPTSCRRRSAGASASSRSTTRPCSWRRTARGCPTSSCSRRGTPRARFEDDGPTGAALLHDALRRLRRRLGASPPLNLWVRTAPRGAEHFCWRIDIVPRLTHLAGLELGTGVHLNVVAPEQAAAELRDA